MMGTYAVITMKPDTVEIIISTQDIMGRIADTVKAANPLPLNGEAARRYQAIGHLVDLAVKRGATSIEILMDTD